MNTVENENHRKVGAIFLPRPLVHLFTHNVHNRKRKHWYYVQRRRYVKARNQSASIVNVERNFLFSAVAVNDLFLPPKVSSEFFEKGVSKTGDFLYLLWGTHSAKMHSRFLQFRGLHFVHFKELALKGASFTPHFLHLLWRDIFQKFLSAYLKICLIFSIYYGSKIFLKNFLERGFICPLIFSL